MRTIRIQQDFKAPLSTVFATLCDHEAFGRLTGANIRRVVDGKAPHLNGLGSVRRIQLLPGLSFEETVVSFRPNELMEYVVSRGSPIKNHKGRLQFVDLGNRTRLDYTIEFEPRWPLPGLGVLLQKAIETPIAAGLRRLARSYADA